MTILLRREAVVAAQAAARMRLTRKVNGARLVMWGPAGERTPAVMQRAESTEEKAAVLRFGQKLRNMEERGEMPGDVGQRFMAQPVVEQEMAQAEMQVPDGQ